MSQVGYLVDDKIFFILSDNRARPVLVPRAKIHCKQFNYELRINLFTPFVISENGTEH